MTSESTEADNSLGVNERRNSRNGRVIKCIRCDSPATLRLHKTYPSCSPCALRGFAARAKPIADLAKGAAQWERAEKANAKGIEPGGLALAFSGGPSSRALLDLAIKFFPLAPLSSAAEGKETVPVSYSKSTTPRDRPVGVSRIDVLYIDDSTVIPGAQDCTDAVKAIVESQGGAQAGLNFISLKLEDVFCDETSDASSAQGVQCLVGAGEFRRIAPKLLSIPEQSRKQLLQQLFALVHSTSTPRASQASARTRTEDIHYILTQQLLRQAARRLGCRSLLLGENASRGSIRLMESLSKGGAHKWPVDGAASVWIDELLVLRPLRNAMSKEIAFYNRHSKLNFLVSTNIVSSSVLSRSAGGGVAEKASIGRLTEHFIYALERGVPSTVSTIGRTGAKLQLKGGEQMGGSFVDSFHEESSNEDLNSISGQKSSMALNKAIKDVPRWSAFGRRKAGASSYSLDHLPLPCPFCGLPSQPGASKWKGKLSIRDPATKGRQSVEDGIISPSDNGTASLSTSQIPESWHALDAMLCYSCLLILDIASGDETPKQDASWRGMRSVLLPPYVLHSVKCRQELQRHADLVTSASLPLTQSSAGSNGVKDVPEFTTQSLKTTLQLPKPEQHQFETDDSATHHVTRKIGTEEMKGKVEDYLL